MNKQSKYSPEVRERAVRMVLEHQGEHASQWAAIGSPPPAPSGAVLLPCSHWASAVGGHVLSHRC